MWEMCIRIGSLHINEKINRVFFIAESSFGKEIALQICQCPSIEGEGDIV